MSPKPNYENIASLREKIENSLCSSNNGEEFLPNDQLGRLITRQSVSEVLTTVNEGALSDYVKNDAARLFLILVFMTTEKQEKVSLIRRLRSDGLENNSLPVKFRKGGAIWKWRWHWSSTSSANPSYPVPEDWGRNETQLFYAYQWMFNVPCFGFGQPFRFRFENDTILPYLELEHKAESKGFFGEVFKVKIHQAHINIPELAGKARNGSVDIALKKANNDPELAKYFDKEAKNLEKLRTYKSKHLIKPIAAYEHRGDRCLIFPWADKGNLYQYWGQCDGNPEMSWITHQLSGLFSALKELHQANCRHGDLKPENILLYVNEANDTILQIADLGLTTFHEQDASTRIRRAANLHTATPPGTSRYEPPETDQDRVEDQNKGIEDRIKNPEVHEARSRAYDIWSMGCIVLELLIWLSNGFDTVDKFRKKTPYLWERDGTDYRIQKHAREHIEAMSKKWKPNSACGDLLKFVQNRLLVIKVSNNNESSPDHRETAAVAWKKMREIQRKHYPVRTTDNGLAPGNRNDHRGIKGSLPTHENNLEEFGRLVGIQRKATEEQKQTSEEKQPDSGCSLVPRKEYQWNSKHEEYNSFQRSNLNDVWESLPDNTFASQVFEHISWYQVRPLSTKEVNILCEDCRAMISTALFGSERHTKTMQQSCRICGLLLDALRTAGVTSSGVVRLRHTGTTIGLENGPNLLSMYTEPGPDVPLGRQIGLPQLPEPNSEEQLTILKQWIRSCDSTHGACRRYAEPNTSDMPTRIVKVTEPIQLLSSSTIGPCRYIALSHCWGRLQEHERFCLYQRNHSQLQERIDFDRLPRTFRDAITLTRGLGIDYIWIDTLCIIQDDKDDWENESTKMEEVFSAAYCTISAASAKSSLDGFLSRRSPRACVQLQMEGSRDLYVCSHIDNFHQDVELAEINQRGWVLQERALSRRSIHYSPTQVYWECGEGIRCETMGRLYNSKAAFLGDANFPKSALDYYRDGRQLLIQDLYERYSALAFTMASDRAIAILGLQKRLARAFKTQAAHGSFEAYFARSILWKRNQPTAMTAIAQPTGRHVPSWSWFSKGGKIQYMHLSFNKIDWMNDNFENPFDRQRDVPSGCRRREDSVVLRGLARGMKISDKELFERVIFDENNELKTKDLRAVVIGRDKDEGTAHTGLNSPRIHVLVVRESTSDYSERIYKRVGVASLLPMQVLAEGTWVDVW